jgi:hypothetical protein
MIKRIFVVILITATVISTSQAQDVFKNGDLAVNAGIGIGWGYGGYVGVSGLVPVPSVNLSVEAGIIEIPEVGVVSVGGFGSFRHTWANSTYYDYTYNSGALALRGAFHFGFFDTGGFDLYAGIHTGVRFSSYTYDDDDDLFDYSDSDVDFLHDLFAGARYMMSDNFGFFAEAGYGVSYLKAGITLKF